MLTMGRHTEKEPCGVHKESRQLQDDKKKVGNLLVSSPTPRVDEVLDMPGNEVGFSPDSTPTFFHATKLPSHPHKTRIPSRPFACPIHTHIS